MVQRVQTLKKQGPKQGSRLLFEVSRTQAHLFFFCLLSRYFHKANILICAVFHLRYLVASCKMGG